MTQTRAAQRYAKAILDIARDENAQEVVTEDFKTIQGALKNSPELGRLLETPVVDQRVKESILLEVFQGKIGEVVARFIGLLTRKGRSADLASITEAYFHLLDAERNVIGAVVTTAAPLSPPQQQELEQRLSSISGKSIRAEYQIDASLIGGFRAIFGDTMIDASLRHQLDRMHETLLPGSLN